MDAGEEIDWLRSMPREEARLGCQDEKRRCDIFRSSCSGFFTCCTTLLCCAAAGQAEICLHKSKHSGRFTFWQRFF